MLYQVIDRPLGRTLVLLDDKGVFLDPSSISSEEYEVFDGMTRLLDCPMVCCTDIRTEAEREVSDDELVALLGSRLSQDEIDDCLYTLRCQQMSNAAIYAAFRHATVAQQ